MLVKRALLSIILAALVPTLQGCLVAGPPLLSAVSAGVLGYSGYTVYKSTEGGSVSVAIDGAEPDRDDLARMAQLRRPAIWPTPGNVGAIVFADKLETLGDYRPHSPSKVAEVLAAKKIAVNLNDLTARERSAAFNTLCEALGADSVIGYAFKGASSESRIWTGVRVKINSALEIYYHSCIDRRPIFNETLNILMESGTTGVSEQIIARDAGEILALRFDGLVRGRGEFMSAARN